MAARGFTTNQTLQDAATGTGNGASINCRGLSWLGLQVTGITTATITWEISYDAGTTWGGVLVTLLSSGAAALTATANGYYRVQCAGLPALFRARISSYTGGTITALALAMVEK